MKKIFKYSINRKEYIYILLFMLIGFTFIYKFVNYDLFLGLKRGVLGSEIIPTTYFAAIYALMIFIAYIYIALLRINETKLPKWVLFTLLVPYINFICIFILSCFPPIAEKQYNRRTRTLILSVCALLFAFFPVLIIYGAEQLMTSVFMVVFCLIIAIVIEALIKLIIFLYKKVVKYYAKCEILKKLKIKFEKIFNFIKSLVHSLKNKIKLNLKFIQDSNLSLTEKLEELSKLKEQGLITEEDYNNKKSKLLKDF